MYMYMYVHVPRGLGKREASDPIAWSTSTVLHPWVI